MERSKRGISHVLNGLDSSYAFIDHIIGSPALSNVFIVTTRGVREFQCWRQEAAIRKGAEGAGKGAPNPSNVLSNSTIIASYTVAQFAANFVALAHVFGKFRQGRFNAKTAHGKPSPSRDCRLRIPGGGCGFVGVQC